MVVSSFSLFAVLACLVDIHSFNFTSTYFCLSLGVSMLKKLISELKKLKDFSIQIMNLLVATIAYWIGVSLSFLLWKISSLRKKENEKTFWLEVEDREEDYSSQY
jgi:predicted membrane channel-forming protein YqfA (hemolysin III family)